MQPNQNNIITQVKQGQQLPNQQELRQAALEGQKQRQQQQQIQQQHSLDTENISDTTSMQQQNNKKENFIKKFCKCLFLTKKVKASNFTDSNSQSDDQGTYRKNLKYEINNIVPEQMPQHKGKKTLVLDLDETLVHSSLQPMENYDHKFEIQVYGQNMTISMKKRVGCEIFLKEMAKHFEIFVYTASLKEYADPVIDIIDPENLVAQRLYREHCTRLRNEYFVKDMTQMNRELRNLILVDNSEISFYLQPENALHIKNFYGDKTDYELFRYMPFLHFLTRCNDVRDVKIWLEIFETKEQILIENENLERINVFRQEFTKYFHTKYPQKYTKIHSQELESEDLPLTARRPQVNEQVNEEPNNEFQEINQDSNGILEDDQIQHNLSKIQKENKKQKDGEDMQDTESINSDFNHRDIQVTSENDANQDHGFMNSPKYTVKGTAFLSKNNQNSLKKPQNRKSISHQNQNNLRNSQSQQKGMSIEINENDENMPTAKESTTAFIAKQNNKNSEVFLSKNKQQQIQNQQIQQLQQAQKKQKENRDNKKNIQKQQLLYTQQNDNYYNNDQSQQQTEEIESARKELFGEYRRENTNKINFNSPLAAQNSKNKQFLSKNKQDNINKSQIQKMNIQNDNNLVGLEDVEIDDNIVEQKIEKLKNEKGNNFDNKQAGQQASQQQSQEKSPNSQGNQSPGTIGQKEDAKTNDQKQKEAQQLQNKNKEENNKNNKNNHGEDNSDKKEEKQNQEQKK